MKYSVIIISLVALFAVTISAQTWTNISSALIQSKGLTMGWYGECTGVCVNRLNGDVVIMINNNNGMWRSTDQGTNWVRIDNNTVGGRCETGVGVNVDQDNPTRIAVFSLDGDVGYTPNGTTWHKMTTMGRNWDFGSVDWGVANPLVMIAMKHEDNGKVYKTADGGVTWSLLSILIYAQGNNEKSSMIGVMDANTFIYCASGDIMRSTDACATWTSASTRTSQTKIPVLFKGKHYLGTATGLLVSADKGATWQTQGGTVEICQGPFFGTDENTMVVVNTQGFYKTTNAGTAWAKVASLPPEHRGYTYDASWFGGATWDPIHNVIYATRMEWPAFKLTLTSTSVSNPITSQQHQVNRNVRRIVNVRQIDKLQAGDIYDITGKSLGSVSPHQSNSSIGAKIVFAKIR